MLSTPVNHSMSETSYDAHHLKLQNIQIRYTETGDNSVAIDQRELGSLISHCCQQTQETFP